MRGAEQGATRSELEARLRALAPGLAPGPSREPVPQSTSDNASYDDRDRLRYLLERLPAVTFSAEIRGGLREVFISPYIEKLLGYTPQEWLSNPILWYDRLHVDERNRWNVEFAGVLSSGDSVESTYRFLAKNGDIRWIRGSVSIQRYADGTPRYVQGVAIDVTEEVSSRAATQEANERLADEMLRTQAANEELRRANEELRNLAYVTAHDLKAPARGITHHLEWLEEQLLEEHVEVSPEVGEHLEKMRLRTGRMTAMIEGLLGYSRIGLVETRPERIELEMLTREIFDDLGDESLIRMHSRTEVEFIVSDRSQLRMVLGNLISNARQHHPCPERGLIEVSIEEAPKSRDRTMVRFEVADNGSGIPARQHERIFEMFRSLRGGTGIGLAMVKKAVEMQGGELELESEPGTGSRFRFTWPRETRQD